MEDVVAPRALSLILVQTMAERAHTGSGPIPTVNDLIRVRFLSCPL